MRIFDIRPDDAGWSRKHDCRLDAHHKHRLPGVACSVCGSTWSAIGLAYPTIKFSTFPACHSLQEHLEGMPVDVEVFKELRNPLRALVPNAPLLPGTQFDQLAGTAEGEFGDFAWHGSWTILIQEAALLDMRKAGVRGLVGVLPNWLFCSPTAERLVELFAEPRLKVSPIPDCGSWRCSACERLHTTWTSQVSVHASSIPDGLDIFRGWDYTGGLFVTERFVEAAEVLGLTNITFKPVEVI